MALVLLVSDYRPGEIEWSSLAYQVSALLTNYLNRTLEERKKDELRAKDALQYVMELLHNMAR